MGCVPNKKLQVQPTNTNKTSRVKFAETPAPPPPSFAPDAFAPDQGLNSSQIGTNFLTASRIAGYDLEQQTKQNTYINSLPMNQKLRASNASITTTTPQSSMVPPLPPLSTHNTLQQDRHNLPRMPTPYPQHYGSEYQQQYNLPQQNMQSMNQQYTMKQQHHMVPVPQFPTTPNIPMVEQTVIQPPNMPPVPQFSQNRPISQMPQIRQTHQLSKSPPPRQMPPLPQPPQHIMPQQMQQFQQTQAHQSYQTSQPPQTQNIPWPSQPPPQQQMQQIQSQLQLQSQINPSQYSHHHTQNQNTLPQFGQVQTPQFQIPTINTRPTPTGSTTSIQLTPQPSFQQSRPVSPNITAVRQPGTGMMPINQDLLRQIMRQTHINDEGFKQIYVQKMDFGRVR